jgi:hypothetical protein
MEYVARRDAFIQEPLNKQMQYGSFTGASDAGDSEYFLPLQKITDKVYSFTFDRLKPVTLVLPPGVPKCDRLK